MKPLSVRVVSDVICPWCYIGKRRLEQALLNLRGSLAPQIVWSPFELNPEMPQQGMERNAYRSAKFGSLKNSEEKDAHVAAVGALEGIKFNFSRIKKTPNTFAAHRLIWLAHKHGNQDEVVEALFQRYFVEGDDIGNREVLVAIAATCGISEAAARAFFATNEGLAEVKLESAGARDQGISGVPTFVVNHSYGIAGAQSPELLTSIFLRAAEATKADPVKRAFVAAGAQK